MEKVKGFFTNIGAWIKAHIVASIVCVVAVVLVIILAIALGGGSSKRAIKKHLNAINSCSGTKIANSMDLKAAYAYAKLDKTDEDDIKNFKDAVKDVEDDDVKDYKERIKDNVKEDKKGVYTYKVKKILSTTKAKKNSNLVKVVAQVEMTYNPKKDEDKDDDDDKDSMWKKEKSYKTTQTAPATFILYKGKVISSTFVASPGSSYSSYLDY